MTLVLAGILWIGAMWAGAWMPITAGAGGVVVLGELYARGRRSGLRPQAGIGLGAVIALVTVGHLKGELVARSLVGLVLALLLATFGEMLVRTDRRRLIETMLASVVPTVFVGVPMAYLAAMRALPEGERLVGTLLLAVFGAELVARIAARVTGVGRGGDAAGLSQASLVRLGGAGLGAVAGAMLAGTLFVPALATSRAWAIAGVVLVAVAASQPVAVLLETVAAPGETGKPMLVRSASGLLLATPFTYYVFVLLAR